MSYGEALVTAPTEEPLSIAEAKTHVGLPQSVRDHDSHLQRLITSARQMVEDEANRQIITATWDFTFDCFPLGRDALLLPRAPLSSISSVSYTDADGGSQTWSSSNYTASTDRDPGRVFPVFNTVWPTTRHIEDALTVRAVCGYGQRADVPDKVRSLLLLLVDGWFNGRSGEGDITPGAQALLDSLDIGDELLCYGREN